MQRSYGKTKFVYEGNTLIGIHICADYGGFGQCVGIDALRDKFGIPLVADKFNKKHLPLNEPPYGIKRRTATEVPLEREIQYDERANIAALGVGFPIYYNYNFEHEKRFLMKLPSDIFPSNSIEDSAEEVVIGAWCDDQFGVFVRGNENVKRLQEFYKAILTKDIVLLRGNKTIPGFEQQGLGICIASKMSDKYDKILTNLDKDQLSLKIISNAIGITKVIDECVKTKYNQKAYSSLTPRWRNKHDPESEYSVVYFLNPADSDRAATGWFTVENLLDWTNGKGPIPLTPDQAKKMKERYF